MPRALPRLDLLALGVLGALVGAGAMALAHSTSPILPVALLAVCAALVVAAARPMTALYLGIAAISLQQFTLPLGAATVSPAEALFVVAGLSWALRRLADGQTPWVPSPLGKPLLAVLLVMIPGLLFAEDTAAILKALIMLTAFVLLYQMVVAEATPRQIRVMLFVLAVTGAAVGLLALAQSAGAAPSEVRELGDVTSGRVSGPFNHPNGLGQFEALALPAAIALALHGTLTFRGGALLTLPPILAGLTLSLSRGGILAAAGALLVMLPWRRFRWTAAVAILLCGALLVGVGSSLSQVSRLDNVLKRVSSVEYSAGGADPRFEGWRASVEMIGDHPILGVGVNQFPNVSSRYGLSDPTVEDFRWHHAHNTALTLTAELGLVGLAVLLWLAFVVVTTLVRAVRRTRGPDRALAVAIAGAIAASTIQGMVDYSLASNVSRALLLALVAGAVVLARGQDAVPKPTTDRRIE
jgi:O-antigen ligase